MSSASRTGMGEHPSPRWMGDGGKSRRDATAAGEEVVLALGSNLGDRYENLERGLSGLARFVTILRVSAVYESPPAGGPEQGDFLNLVLVGATSRSPSELLEGIHEVERAAGRVRDVPDGPRTLDVDIIFFGSKVVREEDLTIPHPRWRERPFVRVPLEEVAPDWVDPDSPQGLTVSERVQDRGEGDARLRLYAPPPRQASK